MNPQNPNESSVKQTILHLHENTQLTVFQIATKLEIQPVEVYHTIKDHTQKTFNETNQENEATVSKDKNKNERNKNMENLRKGDTLYAIDMDKVRGLLGELAGQEALIVNRQSAGASRVNIRMGDLSYT